MAAVVAWPVVGLGQSARPPKASTTAWPLPAADGIRPVSETTTCAQRPGVLDALDGVSHQLLRFR